ncbi:hypothetical protein [Actinophytocola glycyrrhizae]|uniref:Uncharacterized protein n=1 Tax=Actinophytocola glycyrrhizae TaxID=2044873 RepID=A0ABV9S247_9PSEU
MRTWTLHRLRRDPADTAAHHVRRGAKWLNDHTTAYAGRAPITSDMVADLVVMARFGDLRQLAVESYRTGSTVATWLVHFTQDGWRPRRPEPVPGDAVLRGLRYRVVPGRSGREHLYRHLLRCSWTAPVSRR